jgi:hypothetical protein
MKAACSSRGQQKSKNGATGRPICALLAASEDRQRQQTQKAKTQLGLAGPAGWEQEAPESPLARDPAFAASVGTYRRLHVQRRCQSNYAIPHLLKRYAGVRAQQEAAAGSACSGRCSALAVCSSEKRAWALYKGASGATSAAVQATSSAVQATFGAAKSV